MTSKKQLTNSDLANIKKLSKSFVTSVLANIPPTNMCLKMCYPLHLHLKNNCIENSIRKGKYGDIPHYWINLDDKDETIIDPTIRQFDFAKKMTAVYIGKIPSYYNEDFSFKLTNQDNASGLLQAFVRNDTNKKFPAHKVELEKEINLDGERKILLRAWTIINNELEENKKDFSTSELHSEYFKIIKDVLCKYTDQSELNEFLELSEFRKLYKKGFGNEK